MTDAVTTAGVLAPEAADHAKPGAEKVRHEVDAALERALAGSYRSLAATRL